MKSLVSMLALAIALAFTGPAFAGDVATARTKPDCEKAGGVWNAGTNMCSAPVGDVPASDADKKK
jgi:uncharacterized membrane protein